MHPKARFRDNTGFHGLSPAFPGFLRARMPGNAGAMPGKAGKAGALRIARALAFVGFAPARELPGIS
jgi:hypothetical protein